MTDDQDEKINLATMLRGIWPHSPFMAKLARKDSSAQFIDKADDFINAKDTLLALVEPRKGEPKAKHKSSSGDKKSASNHQNRRHERRQEHNAQLIHNNLNVQENEESEREYHQPKTSRPYCKYHQTSSHWTEDCTTMKKSLTELASTGELE